MQTKEQTQAVKHCGTKRPEVNGQTGSSLQEGFRNLNKHCLQTWCEENHVGKYNTQNLEVEVQLFQQVASEHMNEEMVSN